VSFPHKVITFPLNNPIPPSEGTIAGFPKSFQVLSVITFTCVSSPKTQSMSKSSNLASMHSFYLKISDNLTCWWPFRVSLICSNNCSDSFWDSSIILVSRYALGFSWFRFILSTLEINLGQSNTSWSITLQQRQLVLVVEPDYLPNSEVLAFSHVDTP
jgi:hypothetical protein